MASAVNISEGSSVWVEDPNIVWIDGQVKSINGDEAVVLTSDKKKVVTKLSKLYPKDDDTPVGGVDDMTRLSYLHEPGVFYNLATRYQLNNIYTYTGRILIAINPFQRLPDLYETHIMEKYKGVQLGELPPHVFAIADVAYRAVMNEGKSNSILVSGESGAGKTETTKMLMQYLAYLGGHRGGEQRTVEQQVLESNPVLEAFGNAKTVRNDNSSRFGKFVEIQFDKRGRISGAAIRTYLLEKSRVCQTSDPERNYHCFYYLCAAPPEEIETYKLGHPTKFHYLNQSSCNELDGVSDGQQYLITRQAMNVVGISESEQDAIFRVVAAILHLGNVTFAKGEETAILENEKSKFHLHTAAELLKCSIDAFEDAILKRVMVTPEDFIKRSLDPGAAAVSRDGLSKTLYSRLFDWLVDKINVSIGQDSNSKCLIGVLDIYGFESFKYNSFEQFCINLTNEKLQQHFNQHIFKMQQEEYSKEEIDWSYIEFVDNQDILDLMEKKHGGIIALLDEACMFPKSTAQTFAEKLYQTFKSNKRFIKPKLARTEFTISHYAGEVQYQSDQFMEKNKDYVVPEHLDLLIASECPFVSGLFPPVTDDSSSKSSNKCSKFSSIGSRFRLQLYQLMETLNSTDPHYIRCVKPNNHFKPGLFENSNVLHQLRCGGVLEAIRISCLGYPTHKTFSEFLRRFGVLAPEILKENEDERVACKKIMDKMGISGAQIGKTKVFLRANQMADLDGHRLTKLGASSKIIQRNAKGYIARKDYVAERKAAISIQSIYRGLAARKTYANKIQDLATLKIQKTLRGLLDRKSFTRFKDSVIILQTGMRKLGARMMLSQFRYRKQNKKATVIQTYWRRHRAYSYYKRLPLVSVVIQCGWRGMVARTELQKMQVAAAALREAALLEAALREAALQEAALQEAALREAALLEANNELEKQVEDLTLLSEHERSLRVDLEKDMDEEITNMQHSVYVIQTKVDASDASLIQEGNVMQTKVMQTKVDASNTSLIITEGNIMQTKVDASNTSLLEKGSVMQTKVDASNTSLLKECNINREVIEEDSSNIEESVVTVGDNAKIAALTSEVAKLKNLLQCERERADKMEKLYTEALESAQGKRRKLEETESRVNQLQESLNRMISAMSGQFSELKLILSSSSNSSSTSGFPVLEHMEDDSSSSSTASSDSDFTFPAPTSIPPNFSISPGAFHLIVQDLSAAEVSGTENWEGEREGAFDDFF